MSNPKHITEPEQSNHFFRKKLPLWLIVVLAVIALAIPVSTAAWLYDNDSETNVFISGKDLNIRLGETKGNGEPIVPGDIIAKDPSVTVNAGSEPCYLFMHEKSSANTADFLDYTIHTGWSPVSEFVIDGKFDPIYKTNAFYYFDSANDAYNDSLKAYFSNGGTELFTGTKDTNVKMWVGYDNTAVYVYFKMYTPHAASTVRMYYDPDPTASNSVSLTPCINSDDHGDVAFRVDYNNLSVHGECDDFTNNKAPYYNANYFKEKSNLFPFTFRDSTGSGYGFEVRLPRKNDGSNTFKLNFAAENNVGDNNTKFGWTFGPEWWIRHSSMHTFAFNDTFVSQNYDGYYYRIIGDVTSGKLNSDQTFHILHGSSKTDRNGISTANGYVQCRTEKLDGTNITNSLLTNPNVSLSFKAVSIQQQNLVFSKAFELAKPQLDS